jgi:hypothetical protein
VRDDRGANVKVGPEPADVIEVRVGADQPANRFVWRQLRNRLDDRQAAPFVSRRLEHGDEIVELHHVAVGRPSAHQIHTISQLLGGD